MYYEVLEWSFDNQENPEEKERAIGVFENLETAQKVLKEFFENNGPKGWKIIIDHPDDIIVESYDQKTKHHRQYGVSTRIG